MYKKIRISPTETRDEHRLIVEEYLGYRLPRCIAVHHCNGDPTDNRLENLDIMLLTEHSREHMTGTQSPQKGKRLCNHGRTRYEKWGCRCEICAAAKQKHNQSRYKAGNCRSAE